MNLSPSPVQQFFDNNGKPLVGGLLFTYAAGTSTKIATYSNESGTLNTNPIVLDYRGECRIWLDPDLTYKYVLSPSNDTDPPTNQIWSADDISAGLTDADITQQYIGQKLWPRTPEEISTGISPVNYAYPPSYVLRYGTNSVPGITDMRAALQATVTVQQAGGPDAYWPAGIYGVGSASGDAKGNGVLIPYVSANGVTGRVRIHTDGNATVLKALSNNMVVLRVSDSHAEVDNLTIDGNGKTSVWGIGLIPENIAQTSTVVNQLYNRVKAYVLNCDEAVVLQCGPRVSGTDSGCWYNDVDVLAYYCLRGIWLKDPPNLASGVNRNVFRGRIGQNCNTGIQIDSGGTNVFHMHMEGIALGSSPNATPTAVKIAMSDAFGTDNNDNDFQDCHLEANTRDLDNANTNTRIIGGSWTATKFGGGGVKPRVLIVGDPSVCPVIIPGMQYSEGISGYPSTYWGMSKEIADTGYQWQAYAITTGISTNITSVGTGSTSRYTKRGGLVSWHGEIQFAATTAGTEITITPPVAPNATVYCTLNSRNPFYSLFVEDGTGTRKAVEAGWTSGGLFYVKSPTWNTGGNNNIVAFVLEYHE